MSGSGQHRATAGSQPGRRHVRPRHWFTGHAGTGTVTYKGRAHQGRDAEVIPLIPVTPHTPRRVLDAHCVRTARHAKNAGTTRKDQERWESSRKDMRKIIDSAKLAFVPTV